MNSPFTIGNKLWPTLAYELHKTYGRGLFQIGSCDVARNMNGHSVRVTRSMIYIVPLDSMSLLAILAPNILWCDTLLLKLGPEELAFPIPKVGLNHSSKNCGAKEHDKPAY